MDTTTPSDYLAPDWEMTVHVHDWRNYVSHELRAAWPTLAPELRAMLARGFEDVASQEEWD